MKPNIVLMVLDAARADHLSCYGYERSTTPFIDSLADTGLKYENAHANSIWSLPSYGSMFTGQLPSEHGAVDWTRSISKNVLVDELNEAGYNTHAVSPHLLSGDFGIADAFDEAEWVRVKSRDLPFEDDPVRDKVKEKLRDGGWDSELRKYAQIATWIMSEMSYQTIPNGIYHLYRDFRESRGWWQDDGGEEVLDRAKSFIESSSEPFFLFTNFIETHSPYRPPRDYIRRFLPSNVSISEMNAAIHPKMVDKCIHNPPTEKQNEILKSLYDAELAYIDDKIKDFHKYLENNGYGDNTLVIVLSDHGDLFGELELWGHQGRIHNKLTHVPLIANHPSLDSLSVSKPVDLRVLFRLITKTAASGLDSFSVRDCPEYAISEYFGWDTQLSFEPWAVSEYVDEHEWKCYQVSAVSKERIQLIWDSNDRVELYRTNINNIEQLTEDDHQDVVEDIQRYIVNRIGYPEDLHAKYRDRKRDDSKDKYGDELKDHLQELGYFD